MQPIQPAGVGAASSRPRWPAGATVAGLVLALAGPPALVLSGERTFGAAPPLGVQLLLQLLMCSVAGVVVAVVTRCERLPLSSIGVRSPGWSNVALALILAVAILSLMPPITTALIEALPFGRFQPGIAKLVSLPLWFRIFVAVTGGAVEEILYRGYAVERLTVITGRVWLGGVIAVAAFGLAHIPFWGVGPAIGANIPFGAVMVVFYLWRRDVLANAIAHSAILLLGLTTLETAA